MELAKDHFRVFLLAFAASDLLTCPMGGYLCAKADLRTPREKRVKEGGRPTLVAFLDRNIPKRFIDFRLEAN